MIFTALALAAALGLSGAPADWPNGPPRYRHVVVIVEENKDYAQVINPAAAPEIAGLAHGFGLATRFYAEVHPSETNYVALLGGRRA